MDGPRIDDPCVLFALARESHGFLRMFPPTQRFSGAPVRARFCGPAWLSVLVVETGAGAHAVERALDWVLSRPRFGGVPYVPKLLVYGGFAGSLVADLRVGDLVLASEIVDLHGNRWLTTWPTVPFAGDWQPPLRRGPILSSPHLVTEPEKKLALGQQYGALAVDMESAAFARRCIGDGVPFGCLRAISDDSATPLTPELVALLEGGRVSWKRVAFALCRRPSLLREFMRLARATRKAAKQLGAALGELLTLTLDWFEQPE
jgi:hypothetical protein